MRDSGLLCGLFGCRVKDLDPVRCSKVVVKYDGLARYQWQCKRKAVKDGVCTIHSEEFQKAKYAKREAKFNAKQDLMEKDRKAQAEEERRAAAYPRVVAALKGCMERMLIADESTRYSLDLEESRALLRELGEDK